MVASMRARTSARSISSMLSNSGGRNHVAAHGHAQRLEHVFRLDLHGLAQVAACLLQAFAFPGAAFVGQDIAACAQGLVGAGTFLKTLFTLFSSSVTLAPQNVWAAFRSVGQAGFALGE